MTQLIQGLSEILSRYQAVACDIWGVVHNGEVATLEAVDALKKARLEGRFVILVTNSPKTPQGIIQQLDALKIPREAYDRVVSAGLATQYALAAAPHKRAYFIGRDEDQTFFFNDLPQGLELELLPSALDAADCILCAGLDYSKNLLPTDHEIELRQAALRKLPFYCANSDRIVDIGDQRLWCAGAIADLYESLDGGPVYHFGKPNPPIYRVVFDVLQTHFGRDVPPEEILFIGDGVTTDLPGALMEGMDALFITDGLARQEVTAQDGTLDTRKLEAFLQKHGQDPFFALPFLRW